MKFGPFFAILNSIKRSNDSNHGAEDYMGTLLKVNFSILNRLVLVNIMASSAFASDTAHINSQKISLSVVSPLSNSLTINTGESLLPKQHCTEVSGDNVIYSWTKNGQYYPGNGHCLKLTNVTIKSQGAYTVTARVAHRQVIQSSYIIINTK